jgi:hypothetical protein
VVLFACSKNLKERFFTIVVKDDGEYQDDTNKKYRKKNTLNSQPAASQNICSNLAFAKTHIISNIQKLVSLLSNFNPFFSNVLGVENHL